MRSTRRAITVALLATLARASRAREPGFALAPSPGERVRVSHPALPGCVHLPAARARLVSEPLLGGRPAALVAFAFDSLPSEACDLVAVVGADGVGLRVLALEIAQWRRTDGAHLDTRIVVTPDQTKLLLARQAAAPRRDRLAWYREGWTDFLAWRPDRALVDTPVRPPRAGTWQSALARTRSAASEALTPARVGVDATLCALAAAVAAPLQPG